MEFAKLHKVKPAKFYDLNKKRSDASALLHQRRKDVRAEQFNARRNIGDEGIVKLKANNNPIDKSLERKLALKNYQSEKNMKRNKEKENKKPPFVVGIPHHGSSPLLKNISNGETCNNAPIHEEVRLKRVTRAMSKLPYIDNVRQEKLVKEKPNKNIQILENNKSNVIMKTVKTFPLNKLAQFHPPRVWSVKKLTSPRTPTVLKRSVQKSKNTTKPVTQSRCHMATRNTNVPEERELSSHSEELLATPLPQIENLKEDLKSDSADKHVITVKTETVVEGYLKSDDPDKDIVIVKNEEIVLNNDLISASSDTYHQSPDEAQSCSDVKTDAMKQSSDLEKSSTNNACDSITNSEEEANMSVAACQRNKLEHESSRLLALAQVWEEISQVTEDLPSDVIDEIDSVVGQTRLLIKDKFNQFRKLIEEFENKSGSHKITPEDLDGFWDMVFLQVTNLTKRYDELEKLRDNKWIKPSPPMKKKRGRPSKSKPKTGATSTMKEFIKGKRLETFAMPLDTVPCTPSGKSLRVPTPIKPGHCLACRSPLNTNHHCLATNKQETNRSAKSNKKTSVKPDDASYSSDLNPEKASSSTATKKFSLRLSKLIVKTNSFDVSNTPTRRSERKRTCFLPESNEGTTETEIQLAGSPRSESLPHSCKRQARRTRTVMFHSTVEDKNSVKLPSTPFIKRGVRSYQPEDSS